MAPALPDLPRPPTPPLASGLLVPDHTLVSRIGKGGYGEVWLARNVVGQYRAVKIVRRTTFHSAEAYEREFKGLVRFELFSREHEGLVDMLQVGKSSDDTAFYYIMEIADDCLLGQRINPDNYVPKTLAKDLAARGPLSLAECLRIGSSLADALQYLHDQGLVHRDIKPPNIIFVNDHPKLADIGLVTRFDEAKSYVGTPGFMPPEGPGSPQADVFSLGMVLYQMFTGLPVQDFPELPASLLKEGPDQEKLARFNTIILKACRSHPRQRYRTARKMREDLPALASKTVPHPRGK